MNKRIKSIEFSDMEPCDDGYVQVATIKYSDGSEIQHGVSGGNVTNLSLDEIHAISADRSLDYVKRFCLLPGCEIVSGHLKLS